MAVKACSWMAGSAFNNGASDTAVLPIDLSYRNRLDQFERHHGGAVRDLAAAKPDTKRASVCEVAPRGSMTSTSENRPRRATARSSAS
jgi:hypothetical protein